MASEGPNSPVTVANDSSAGTAAWTNPGNATANDGSNAEFNGSTDFTQYLKATDFGFAIPAGATIDGILVEYEALTSIFGSTAGRDWRVRIVKGGAVGTTDKAVAASWPTTATYLSRGGSTDLWGETWAVDDVNASGFGVVIAAQDDQFPGLESSFQVYVDHVRITVYYTEGGVSTSPTAVSATASVVAPALSLSFAPAAVSAPATVVAQVASVAPAPDPVALVSAVATPAQALGAAPTPVTLTISIVAPALTLTIAPNAVQSTISVTTTATGLSLAIDAISIAAAINTPDTEIDLSQSAITISTAVPAVTTGSSSNVSPSPVIVSATVVTTATLLSLAVSLIVVTATVISPTTSLIGTTIVLVFDQADIPYLQVDTADIPYLQTESMNIPYLQVDFPLLP